MFKIDISQFYPSIYTHSIPWALHGKTTSPKKRYAKFLGNNLDYLLRTWQEGQTKGIPIGPDVSFLMAEIILADADNKLEGRISKLNGFRYIDDYEFVTDSYSSAERILNEIESVLNEYELTLNSSKN